MSAHGLSEKRPQDNILLSLALVVFARSVSLRIPSSVASSKNKKELSAVRRMTIFLTTKCNHRYTNVCSLYTNIPQEEGIKVVC